MDIKQTMKHWKAGAIGRDLWSEHAQHGTVMIDTSEEAASAVIVDNHGGIRAAFKVPPGQIGEVIGAAAQAWMERGASGSFGVFLQSGRERGGLTPPPPPPPPGPGGHERIFMIQTVAAHVSLGAAAELVRLEELGERQR